MLDLRDRDENETKKIRYWRGKKQCESEACLTNGRSQLRSSSFAEEARFLLDVVGSNPISALSKGFILHHSPRRSRPRKVFEAAEAGSDNTAFLQHILDDLSENGVQSSAFKEAMNQIGLVAQSPLDQFEIGGGNLVPNAWQSLVELLYDFVLNLGMIPYSFTVTRVPLPFIIEQKRGMRVVLFRAVTQPLSLQSSDFAPECLR
ncbi:unnamed protein product [Eruca vesicaria subsp. sativa]|uniref:Uncharacterized protein n=1 Tax=Eruca vesicaria subsp. sativa TaxID=29727 RepID=A0ABC8J082_ERUVS|nr:unnamed protein product [Eruca vesicaria subsp. sativa]